MIQRMSRFISVIVLVSFVFMVFYDLFTGDDDLFLEENIWVVALVVGVASIVLAHKAFELRNLLNPFCFHFLYFLVFNYMVLCFPFETELFRNPMGLFQASSLYLVMYLFGGLARKGGRREIADTGRWSRVFEWDTTDSRKGARVAFAWGIALVLIHYVFVAGDIPLFHPDRENFRVLSKAGQGQLITIGMTSLFVGTIVILVDTGRRLPGRKGVWLAVFLATAFLLMSGFREMAFQLCIVAGVVFFTVRGYYPSFGRLIMISIVGLVFLGVLGVYRWGEEGVTALRDASIPEYGLWALSRPAATSWGLDFVLDEFGTHSSLLYGRSYIIDLVTLLPGYQPNFGFWLKEYFGMTWAGGSLMIGSHGIFYINFGYIGLAVLAFLNGWLAVAIYDRLARRASKKMLAIALILSINAVGIDNIQGLVYAIGLQLFVLFLIRGKWLSVSPNDIRQMSATTLNVTRATPQ